MLLLFVLVVFETGEQWAVRHNYYEKHRMAYILVKWGDKAKIVKIGNHSNFFRKLDFYMKNIKICD